MSFPDRRLPAPTQAAWNHPAIYDPPCQTWWPQAARHVPRLGGEDDDDDDEAREEADVTPWGAAGGVGFYVGIP